MDNILDTQNPDGSSDNSDDLKLIHDTWLDGENGSELEQFASEEIHRLGLQGAFPLDREYFPIEIDLLPEHHARIAELTKNLPLEHSVLNAVDGTREILTIFK